MAIETPATKLHLATLYPVSTMDHSANWRALEDNQTQRKTWNPSIRQGVDLATTVEAAYFRTIANMCFGFAYVTAGADGSAVTLSVRENDSLPPPLDLGALVIPVGSGIHIAGSDMVTLATTMQTAGNFLFQATGTGIFYHGAITTGDTLRFAFQYFIA